MPFLVVTGVICFKTTTFSGFICTKSAFTAEFNLPLYNSAFELEKLSNLLLTRRVIEVIAKEEIITKGFQIDTF